MRHFIPFGDVSESELSPRLVGGKANALARLHQAQFPVPDGFVITTDFLSSISKENFVFRTEDYESLQQHIDRCSPSGIVAVRSSASTEDSQHLSYAGQFDSFIDVPKARVVDTIEKCWRSQHNERVLAYAGATQHEMAVVVQDMIIPDVAGVAFSVDPVSGDRDVVVIEAVRGSSEQLVQGAITPDSYHVRKNFSIAERTMSTDDQILSDEDIIRVAQLALGARRLFNTEVDIEWAITGNALYILQSRPITSLYRE